MSPAVAVDDELWTAVGEPSRRRLLDLLLSDGEATATSLAQQLPLTRQAVAKHLGVLDRAGLVSATPRGREVRYRVQAQQVQRAVATMAGVAHAWDSRLNAIKRISETIQREQAASAQ